MDEQNFMRSRLAFAFPVLQYPRGVSDGLSRAQASLDTRDYSPKRIFYIFWKVVLDLRTLLRDFFYSYDHSYNH